MFLTGDIDVASARKVAQDLKSWVEDLKGQTAPSTLEVAVTFPTQITLQLLFSAAKSAEATNVRVDFGPNASVLLGQIAS